MSSAAGSEPSGVDAETPPVRLLVVDDHPVVCSGIVQLLQPEPGIEVVAAAGDGEQAVALAAEVEPDVVLMDLRMPGTGGVEATRRVRALPNPPRVVILTTYETDADVARAVAAGAIGYLLKDSTREQIASAVRTAAQGCAAMSEVVTTCFLRATRQAAAGDLSPREREVLTAVAQGLSNTEAAQQLYVSEATIKTHLRRIYAKLCVDCRTAAVTEAVRRGLVEI
ncbi:MAG: response regulator transcription factor [Actinomycetia bacterium]|nr:response regulator transcription factor [Actinomycetes bacterium]